MSKLELLKKEFEKRNFGVKVTSEDSFDFYCNFGEGNIDIKDDHISYSLCFDDEYYDQNTIIWLKEDTEESIVGYILQR